MVVRTIDVENDPFRPPSDEEEILGLEVSYLSGIRALLFLASEEAPTIVHEDNAVCIAQLKDGYIK
ncbi:hypothetical protein Tco_0355969, partial [Tanacetum coccineum]